LDSSSAKEIMNLLKSVKEEGKLIILISHDTDLSYEYADRIIILNEGEIIKDAEFFDAFNDTEILEKARLVEPFVNRVKRTLNLKASLIRNIEDLKEVIKCG
jgi:cobalt/nickel transport system ATP-binding protein